LKKRSKEILKLFLNFENKGKSGEPKPNYVPLYNDNVLLNEDFLGKLNFTKKSKTPSSKYNKPKPTVGKKKTTSVSISPVETATSGSPMSGGINSALSNHSRTKSPKTKS
jgi:hypothetical protein